MEQHDVSCCHTSVPLVTAGMVAGGMVAAKLPASASCWPHLPQAAYRAIAIHICGGHQVLQIRLWDELPLGL